MPFQSFDDIFKNTSQGFISFDNIFGQQTGFISFDDLFAKQKVDVRRPEPTRRYGGVGNVLEQFGRGAVREATLGLSKYALGEEAPIGFAEKFARGAGQFAGYLIPIGIGAKVAGATVKGASKIASGAIKAAAPRATPKTIQSATRLFEHMFKSSTTLATADVVSDITNISEAPQRAVSGATIGAIFGGSHLINLTKKAPLDNIIRQFAGRGMLMAAGHYSPEHMTKENIPNIVFGEILNTFFLSRGIRAKDIMEGRVTGSQAKLAEDIQKQINDVNTNIAIPTTGQKIPSIVKLFHTLGKGELTAKDLQLMNVIENFRYDLKSKKTYPLEEIPKPGVNDIILHRDPATGMIDVTSVGKTARTLSDEAKLDVFSTVKKQTQKIIDFPAKKIDPLTAKSIDDMLEKLKFIPANDLKTVAKMFNVTGDIRYRDLPGLESFIKGMADNPGHASTMLGNRVLEFATAGKVVGEHTFGNKDQGIRSRKLLGGIETKRLAKVQKLYSEISSGKKRGSPLSNILRLTNPEHFLDARLIFALKERDSGLPFARIHRMNQRGEGMRDHVMREAMKPLERLGPMGEKRMRRLEDYYKSNFTQRDPVLKKRLYDALEPKDREYVNTYDKIIGELAPFIKKYRWDRWYSSWLEVQDPQNKRTKAMKVFTKQKELSPKLEEAATQYRNFGGEKTEVGRDFLERFLETNDFGIIEAGNYLPGIFMSRRNIKTLEPDEFSDFIDFVPDRHTKSRGVIEGTQLRDMLMDEYLEKPLNVRVDNYVRNILSLKYLKEPLEALGKLTGIVSDHLERALTTQLGGKNVDKKAYAFLDYIKLYAHRKKNYPVKIGQIGRLAKITQSAFFKSLVVRPRLWLRNLFQGTILGVTVPDKAVMADLRFHGLFNKKMAFKSIPDIYKEKFDIEVSQFAPMEKHHLFLQETENWKDIPVVGGFFKLAERVGKMYPLSDLMNRRSVFAKTFNRTLYYLNQYKNGKMTEDQVWGKLKIGKMKEIEQVEWNKILDSNVADAAYFHAKWMSDNSQWIYNRGEKSLYEMTGEGEAFTNLFTWSKGMTQRMVSSVNDVYRGFADGDYRRMSLGVTEIGGLAIAATMANTALQFITMKHGSRYQDYGTDMFFWEIGGVSFDLIKEATTTLAGLIGAFDGTKGERKRAMSEALKFFDNSAMRQMMPFMKNALSVVESITGRSYISPLYDLVNRKATKVDRTLVEGISHAIFSTDPNKSKDTYKFVTERYEKFKRKYQLNTNPVTKQLDYLQFKRYEYLSSVLDRYQPLEAYDFFDELERKQSKYGSNWMEETAAEQRRKISQMQRMWR